MDITKHPILQRLYDIGLEHEESPSSKMQTAISVVLNDAMEEIERIVDSCDKTSENEEFSEMTKQETEQNVKHIQSMIAEDNKR